jgi:transcriptional regulator with XRE-family HTH domain
MLASHARMHSIHKLFGNRVRQLREEQQLGAADVAALIGCDVSHYYSIERGAHPPSFALLLAIAKTFKVDEADLFTWPGSGLRHDLREQVRLATPPALAAVKAALSGAASSNGAPAATTRRTSAGAGAATSGRAGGRPSDYDGSTAPTSPAPAEPRRRSRR